MEFVASTSDYEFIADLHGGNFVMLKDGTWIAIDFGAASEAKFKKYRKMVFKHFEFRDGTRRELLQMKKDGLSVESIMENLEKFDPEYFARMTTNVFTDPDPNMKPFMEVPAEWVGDFRRAIFKRRFAKLSQEDETQGETQGEIQGEEDVQNQASHTTKLNYTFLKNQGLHQIEIDPKEIAIKIAHTNQWANPKTVLEYVKEYHALGGINGGFWTFPPDAGTAGYYWRKLKERVSGTLNFALDKDLVMPIAIIKTPKALVSDTPDFWAAIGWSNKSGLSPLSDFLAVDWELELDGSVFPLKRIHYDSTLPTYLFLKRGESRFEKWDFARQRVNHVDRIDEKFGSIFELEETESVKSAVQKKQGRFVDFKFVPTFVTPLDQQHTQRDRSHHKLWAAMDYILSGKWLMHKGEIVDLHDDYDYAKYVKADAKTSFCLTGSATWLFLVSEYLTLQELQNFMKSNGCTEALLLDGGSSSTMALRNEKGVIEDVTATFSRAQTGGKIRSLSDSIVFIPK